MTINNAHDFQTKLAAEVNSFTKIASTSHAISFLLSLDSVKNFLKSKRVSEQEIAKINTEWNKIKSRRTKQSSHETKIDENVVAISHSAEFKYPNDRLSYQIRLLRDLLITNYFSENNGVISTIPTMQHLWNSGIQPDRLFPKEFNIAKLNFEMSKEENGIPSSIGNKLISKIKRNEDEKLLNLLPALQSRIFGQDSAIKTIADKIIVSTIIKNNSFGPMASMLFVGPTGTGKTETARTLSETLDRPIITFDMHAYDTFDSSYILFGATPGSSGYENGGILTENIAKQPNAIIVFDNIDRAHKKIQENLLQILDSGSTRTNKGADISFQNTIIIATSNTLEKNKSVVGYKTSTNEKEPSYKVLKPEILSRFGEPIKFNKLEKIHYQDILEYNINQMNEQLMFDYGLSILVTDEVSNKLLNTVSEKSGARQIQQIFNENIAINASRYILSGYKTKNMVALITEIDQNKIAKFQLYTSAQFKQLISDQGK